MKVRQVGAWKEVTNQIQVRKALILTNWYSISYNNEGSNWRFQPALEINVQVDEYPTDMHTINIVPRDIQNVWSFDVLRNELE